jgi:hypothetical protein
MIQQGRKKEAFSALSPEGQFHHLTDELITALKDLLKPAAVKPSTPKTLTHEEWEEF